MNARRSPIAPTTDVRRSAEIAAAVTLPAAARRPRRAGSGGADDRDGSRDHDRVRCPRHPDGARSVRSPTPRRPRPTAVRPYDPFHDPTPPALQGAGPVAGPRPASAPRGTGASASGRMDAARVSARRTLGVAGALALAAWCAWATRVHRSRRGPRALRAGDGPAMTRSPASCCVPCSPAPLRRGGGDARCTGIVYARRDNGEGARRARRRDDTEDTVIRPRSTSPSACDRGLSDPFGGHRHPTAHGDGPSPARRALVPGRRHRPADRHASIPRTPCPGPRRRASAR